MSANNIQRIPRAERPQGEVLPARVQFESNMVILRHLADTAQKEDAEYYFRTLFEQCKFLSRKHGFQIR